MSYWITRKNKVDKVNKLKRGPSRRAVINFLKLYAKYTSSKPEYYITLPNTCPIKKALEEP